MWLPFDSSCLGHSSRTPHVIITVVVLLSISRLNHTLSPYYHRACCLLFIPLSAMLTYIRSALSLIDTDISYLSGLSSPTDSDLLLLSHGHSSLIYFLYGPDSCQLAPDQRELIVLRLLMYREIVRGLDQFSYFRMMYLSYMSSIDSLRVLLGPQVSSDDLDVDVLETLVRLLAPREDK